MATLDVLGGLAVVFGLLNVLAPGFGFRSRWLTATDSKATAAGTELTRITGGVLVVVGVVLLLV